VLVGEGDLAFCDQFEMDASGKVRPLIVNRRQLRASDILRGDRLGQLTVPGFDFRYYRIASDGYVIWSLRLSLLIPSVLLLLVAVFLRRRLKRLGRQPDASPAIPGRVPVRWGE
jgi:hypothetical protein